MSGCDAKPRDMLEQVKPELARQGLKPDGPRTGWLPLADHLTLADGRIVFAELDGEDCWQLLVYDGCLLASIADPDGRDFPGDPV